MFAFLPVHVNTGESGKHVLTVSASVKFLVSHTYT